MRHKHAYLLLAFACGLVVVQALPFLDGRWVEDESWYAIRGWTLLTQGRIANPTFAETDIEYLYDTSPPLQPVVLAGTFKAFGVGVVQARMPSVLACLGLVVLGFFLVKELAGLWAGALGALVIACDTIVFLAARCARPDALVAFFSTLALVLYFIARRKDSFWIAAAAGLAAGTAMNFHPNGLAVAVSLGLLMLFEFRLSIWRRGRFWALVLGIALCGLPTVYRLKTNPAFAEATFRLYGRMTGDPVATKFRRELLRYEGFIGYARADQGVPWRAPLRLHIALLVVASLLVLFRRNRALFFRVLVFLLPLMAWLCLMPMKAPRYLVIASPYLAVAVGAALAATAESRTRWSRALVATGLLCVLTQVAGNALLIRQFRAANYPALTRQLQAVIPPGETVYGAVTFWLALKEHPYCSYHRNPFRYALVARKPTYFILNDRVMLQGDGWGSDFATLRSVATTFLQEHGQLVGKVSNPFYGDLLIYHCASCNTASVR